MYPWEVVWDLTRLFLLNDFNKIIESEQFGLYRNDSLIIINKLKCEQERTAKKNRSIFEDHVFTITIDRNIFQTVFFLDISLNLRNNKYEPYKKEYSEIKYIPNQSNNPKIIIKDIQ